jgi:hypothetical protein
MLVSKSKFYKEVTGSNTGNAASTVTALKRWNIPFIEGNGKDDCVDITHLAAAKEAYAKEQAERPTPQKSSAVQREVVQTIASRLAVLEDDFNKFRNTMIEWRNEQIKWNGTFGTKLNVVAFKPEQRKKSTKTR